MQDEDAVPQSPEGTTGSLPGEPSPDAPFPGEPFPYEPLAHEDPAPGGEDGYTTADFHNVIQKQVLNATYETLVETKLHWGLIEPFLHAAREMCRGDFQRTGRLQIHGAVAEGQGRAETEEAYVSLSIADQDDGREWLAQTWWLSDLVLAGGDPALVREAARALERTKAKLDGWLAANEEGPREDG